MRGRGAAAQRRKSSRCASGRRPQGTGRAARVAAAGVAPRSAAARAKASLDALERAAGRRGRPRRGEEGRGAKRRLASMQASPTGCRPSLAARAGRLGRGRPARRQRRQRAGQPAGRGPGAARAAATSQAGQRAGVLGVRHALPPDPALQADARRAWTSRWPAARRSTRAADGDVIMAGWGGGYGNRIIMDHGWLNGNDLATTYNHLSRIVRSGGHVDARRGDRLLRHDRPVDRMPPALRGPDQRHAGQPARWL